MKEDELTLQLNFLADDQLAIDPSVEKVDWQTTTSVEPVKSDKGSVLNSALGLIHDDYKDLASAQLSNMLKISYNDQGEAITAFEHEGKVIANNVSEFKSWAGEQASFKKI